MDWGVGRWRLRGGPWGWLRIVVGQDKGVVVGLRQGRVSSVQRRRCLLLSEEGL